MIRVVPLSQIVAFSPCERSALTRATTPVAAKHEVLPVTAFDGKLSSN